MDKLNLHLFGTQQLEINSKPIRVSRKKIWAILALLAVPGTPLTRDKLCYYLWPESNESNARRNLRRDLYELSQLVPKIPFIDKLTKDTVGLSLGREIWVDVFAYIQKFNSVNNRYDMPLTNKDSETLIEVADLYRGDFLDGFILGGVAPFNDWADDQRRILRNRQTKVLETISNHFINQVSFPEAIEYVQRWLVLDSWNEVAHMNLMKLYVQTKQTNKALAQFNEYKQILNDELDTTPTSEAIGLYEDILSSSKQNKPSSTISETTDMYNLKDKSLFASSKKEAAVDFTFESVTLPARPKLFGRDEILHGILNTLVDESALPIITIDGLGGIGKSAIALEVAHRCQEQGLFDHIIWIHASEAYESILNKIGSNLGIREFRQPLPIRIKQNLISNVLSKHRILLVLDNMEAGLVPQDEIASKLPAILGKGKALLTSRNRFIGSKLYTVHLLGLEKSEILGFFHETVKRKTLTNLFDIEDTTIDLIGQKTGGSPLAMQLVVSQLEYADSLDIVFQKLEQVRPLQNRDLSGKEYEEFYRYIYHHSWDLIRDDNAKFTLLAMATLSEGNETTSVALAEIYRRLKLNSLRQALVELWHFSLVEMRHQNVQKYYSLHPLTRMYILSDKAGIE